MSIKLMTKAWETEAKGNDLLVLLALCDFANDDGEFYPSLKKIAYKAKVAKSTLSYILRAFEKVGVLYREQRQRENGSNTSTYYKILTLDFDYNLYKKFYQEARNYKPQNSENGSQCEHPKSEKKVHNVNTPNQNCEQGVVRKCEQLEPSLNNRQVFNRQYKKNYIKKRFQEFLKFLEVAFGNLAILTLRQKITQTDKTKEEFSKLDLEALDLNDLAMQFAIYVQANKKFAARLDKWLVAYRENNLDTINYTTQNKQNNQKQKDAIDEYFDQLEANINDTELIEAEVVQ